MDLGQLCSCPICPSTHPTSGLPGPVGTVATGSRHGALPPLARLLPNGCWQSATCSIGSHFTKDFSTAINSFPGLDRTVIVVLSLKRNKNRACALSHFQDLKTKKSFMNKSKVSSWQAICYSYPYCMRTGWHVIVIEILLSLRLLQYCTVECKQCKEVIIWKVSWCSTVLKMAFSVSGKQKVVIEVIGDQQRLCQALSSILHRNI